MVVVVLQRLGENGDFKLLFLKMFGDVLNLDELVSRNLGYRSIG